VINNPMIQWSKYERKIKEAPSPNPNSNHP